MNKVIKGLLVAAFAVSTATATTNKTFLMPRSQGVNLAMEYATYNELINHKNGDFFGAHFQVVPFYMESNDKTGLGKYFGVNNENLIALSNAADADVNYRYMIHDAVPGGAPGVGTVKYEPELQAYGARIDYYQDLEKVLDGLYLKIALPIVHVENDMHISTAVTTEHLNFTAANLENYFKGTAFGAVGEVNNQAALKYAKIDGSKSETSVADIDVVLGYKIFDKDDYNVALNIGLTIPVGNDADGVWVFEPMVGNGDHWALGGGLEAWVKLWEDGKQNIKLTAAANYRYLFEATEKRTMGLVDPAGNSVNWGQYYLAGTIDAVRGTQQLFPAANILTHDIKVEPGSQFDSIIYLTYNNGGWTFDLGYNFFWKEAEDNSLKGTWTDGVYGVARIDQTMAAAQTAVFDLSNAAAGDAQVGGSLGYINNTPNNAALPAVNVAGTTAYGIDVSATETPSMDTHKIWGAMGYNFKDWEYPVMLGLGGGYEFADQEGIENWQIWGKLGVKF
jgi:extradiol dioxygenase family protein